MNALRKLLFLSFAALVGCGTAQDSTGVGNPGLTQQEQALYDDGDEGRKAGDIASALAFVPHAAITEPGQIMTGDGAALVGEFGKAAFTPDTCRTSTRVGNVVTFTFNNCRYLAGYTGVTGQLRAEYEPSPGQLTIRVNTIAPFTLETFNKRLEPITITLELTSEVTVRFVSGGKRFDWNTTYSASNGSATVSHTATYSSTRTATETRACVTLDGGATTTFPGGRGVEGTVVGYVRCGDSRACPEAGGKVTFTATGDRTKFITIEFLGGRLVRVTVPNRPAFETDKLLQCTG
jgi:hypothetical protein